MLWVSRGLRSWILTSLLQCTEQPPTAKNWSVQKVNGAKFERTCPKLCRSEIACHVLKPWEALFMAVIYQDHNYVFYCLCVRTSWDEDEEIYGECQGEALKKGLKSGNSNKIVP